MEIIARANSVRISTRKVRLVADSLRNLPIASALSILETTSKRGGYVIKKNLDSAISNALNNFGIKKEDLRIKAIEVNEGAFLKRYKPSTRGRVHPYKKRSTNIKIILEGEKKGESK